MEERMKEYRARFAALVDEHGWAVQAVMGDETTPPMAYTVGLTDRFEHPELVICGLPQEIAHSLLHDLVRRLEAGAEFRDGARLDGLLRDDLPVVFHEVLSVVAADQFRVAGWWYREHRQQPLPRFLQMLWSDADGRLPGEPGCDPKMTDAQMLGGLDPDKE